MQMAQRTYADILVLSPAGRLDHDNCDAFSAALQPFVDGTRNGRAIVLDMSRLEYVSSAGLRLLMLAGKQASAQGGRIVVAAMRPLVAEIFHISRFGTLFETHPGVREALTAASAQAAAAFDQG